MPADKAALAAEAARAMSEGRLALDGTGPAMPDRPARPERPHLLPPSAMPKRGRGGSARARFALFHALAHIELNAIDLAADMAGRFGTGMPPAFAADWLSIAADEGRHFLALERLLTEAGGRYGDLPAHDGLWEAAEATAGNLAARLAVVPQVLEARGLDVTPAMISRLQMAGDDAAVGVLSMIYTDEIGHVAAGNRWFRHVLADSDERPEIAFRRLVAAHFRGALKPPFNASARARAGLTTEWYAPLAQTAPISH